MVTRSAVAFKSINHFKVSDILAYFIMDITSNGQIKISTVVVKRKAMPMYPALIAKNTIYRHAEVLIAEVHERERYNLFFLCLSIFLSNIFITVIPVLISNTKWDAGKFIDFK
jgi:hypothetical protein